MAFKSSSVINLVYSYMTNQNTIRKQSTILVILPTWAVFSLSLSLPPQILPKSALSPRTVNKTSWSHPRQTRICYIFWHRVIIKALLKQISLYLLSHFRIRIILVTCPDNKSARKSSAEIMRACKITQITMMQGQYYFNWNLRFLSVCSCSCEDLRVPPLNLY